MLTRHTSSGGPLTSVTDQLAEKEAIVSRLDQRLAAIKAELADIDTKTIDKNHLLDTLAQFEPLWEVLSETERTRLVNLVVESAVIDPDSGQVSLELRTDRFCQ